MEQEEDGGYKQTKTINYHLKEEGRRNKKQLLLRPDSKTIKRLDDIKFFRDFNGSNQELINLLIDEAYEKVIKDRICYEDPTMVNLIKEAKDAEKIHNYLFDKGYNPDERRRIINSSVIKDERMKDRLEQLEEDWFNQHQLSLKSRGRLRGYR